MTTEKQQSVAITDISEGLSNWRLWWGLAWQDMRVRYRRTLLGPAWISVQMLVLACALALVYSAIFKNAIAAYLPYLMGGLCIWGLVHGLAIEASNIFVEAKPLILSMRMPLAVHVLRALSRNIVVFAHNIIAFAIIAVIIGVSFGSAILLLLPGIVLVILNISWAALLLSLIGARYRDLNQVVASMMQLGFFVTPILWDRRVFTNASLYWVDWNPLYQLVEVVRAPLLNTTPVPFTYMFLIAGAFIGWCLTIAVFVRCRQKVPYWI